MQLNLQVCELPCLEKTQLSTQSWLSSLSQLVIDPWLLMGLELQRSRSAGLCYGGCEEELFEASMLGKEESKTAIFSSACAAPTF